MNNKRRKEITNICNQITSEIQNGNSDFDIISNLISDLEYCVDEERDSLDNYPESLQETDSWIEFDENCDELVDIVQELNSTIDPDDEDSLAEISDIISEVQLYL